MRSEDGSSVCVLILAHKAASLALLLRLLGSRFPVFVHLDEKLYDSPPPRGLSQNVRFHHQRFPVFWGGFNMIRATRALIRQAVEEEPGAARFILISGDALPVVPLDVMEERLSDPNEEFIDMVPVPDDPSLRNVTHEQARERYHWLQPYKFQNYVYWDHILTNPRTEAAIMERYSLTREKANDLRSQVHHISQAIFQLLPHRTRLFRELYFGSQWWALSRQAIELMWDDLFDPEIETFFQYLDVPDEHFFHCLFGKQLGYRRRAGFKQSGSFMYVDHADPVRASFGDDALRSDQFRSAAASGALFARKFDPAKCSDVASAILRDVYFSQIVALQ